MMKVYDIETAYNYGQVHSVVAESMAEAERLHKTKYPYTTIREIKLHSEYVIVAELMEEA